MAEERLIFPIGFDLEEGVKEAEKEWKSTYRKELQTTINKTPLKIKLDIDPKGLDLKSLKDYTKLTKEATKAAKDAADVASKRALQRERESKARVAEATEAAKIAKAKAQQEAAEVRLASAKERAAKASRSQTIEYGRQMGYIERLITRLGVYTGIYAAAGMLRDIRETTAEFELQEVALGAIIQDAHEAQVLFSQIKAAAVESPYQIKELVNYTKQLAAYGFEQNALFDTTMKLADISAGLGADMSRIILAVGQISAATVLKGTELRQLTELGIPMVELLAEKFTQLRGEVVSTGEVFEMISDKAVSFKMVEEILNDLTSAGGMFYDMQRKQADTLAGQWSNLKDSIAIAYDEIGNTGTVRGAMEGWISMVKNLVENWRTVSGVIGGVISSFVGVKVASMFIPRLIADTKMLAKATADLALAEERYNAAQDGTLAKTSAKWAINQAKYMKMAANATTVFSRSWYKLAASMAGGGWIGLAVTAITVLISWLVSAQKEANRLDEELNRIGSESALQTAQSVRNFERLANAAANAVDGTKEQADALAELHRSYRDVIPIQDMTIDRLREMQGEYKSLTAAIKEKIAMQAKEEQINLITSEYGGKTSKKEKRAREFLVESGLSSAEATAVMDEIRKAVDDGLIDTTADISEQARQIEKVVYDTTGRVVDMMQAIYRQVAGTTQTVLTGFRPTKMLKIITKLIGHYTDLNSKLKDVYDSYDTTTGKMGKYGDAFEKLQTGLKDVVGEGKQFSFEWNESILRQKVDLYKQTIKGMLKEENIDYKIGDYIDFTEIGEAISSATPQIKTAISEIEKEYNKLVPTDRMSKVIKDKFIEVAESTGASMDALQGYLKNADTSVTDWAKSIEEAVSSTEKKLNEMTFTNQQIEAGLGGPLRPYDEQEIDSTTNKLTALKDILEWISSFLTTQKTIPPDNRLRDLNEEVSLLEKVYAKYKEFVKYVSSTEAEAKTRDYFADTIGSLRFGAAFDTTKLKEILTKYQDAARSLPESDKTVLELGFKVDDVSWQETLDDMKERVAELADAVARSKEAKDFYDKMLGMTGDRQLSADLTMSVYGGVGDDLKENIKRQLTEAFKGVDISDAISGENIDYKALEKLIGTLEDMQANARKIVEEGMKANADIIQDLYKTLVKFEDYEDKRMTILRNGIEQRRKIEQADIAQAEKDRLKAASQNEESKALAKLDYEQFKSSDMYITMFENLDYVSADTLKRMKERLLELKTTLGERLDPNQIKEIVTKMEDIDAELSRKNPFKTLAESIQTYKNEYGKISRKKLEGQLTTAQDEVDVQKENVRNSQKALLNAEKEVEVAEEKYRVDSREAKLARIALMNARQALDVEKQNLSKKEAALDKLNDQARAWRNIKKATKEAIEGEDGIVDWLNSTQSMLDSIKNLGEGMGAGDEFSGWMEALSGIVGGAGSTTTGIGQILSGQWAQGLANVVKGLSDVALGIFDASYVERITNANAEIAKQEKTLSDLSAAYERLEQAQEDALGSDYIANYNARLENLAAQAEAYQKQADAERDKGKKADEEAIKQYEQSALESARSIEDMQGELAQYFLGTDVASAARDFAKAWIDAYKEFGSTTDAMKEKFSEMVENMVVESLAAKVIQGHMQDIFDTVESLSKDGQLSVSDAAHIAQLSKLATENIDVGMANLMAALEAAGISVRGMGTDLTGISKDIATASEESILGLAAGINTQNFYISQVPPKLDTIIAILQGGASPVGGINVQDLITIQNQHLAYLPNIADNTARTADRCERAAVACETILSKINGVVSARGSASNLVVNTN